MATTPTIFLSAIEPFIVIYGHSTVNTDTLQLWKAAPAAAPVKISSGMTITAAGGGGYDVGFVDYNVESGTAYTYFIRAVDGSNNTADSAQAITSVTLSSGWLHSVSKSDPDRNIGRVISKVPMAVQLLDQGYQNAYAYAGQGLAYGKNALADIRQSTISEDTANLTATVPSANDANRLVLQAIFNSNQFTCLRKATGGIYFGRIRPPYGEQYRDLATMLALQFDILDFSEAAA